jgi:filamentous hemagglutinin family protein
MTQSPHRPSFRRSRQELLARTAICGVLAVAAPLLAATPADATPVLQSTQVSAGGGAPTISTGPTTSVDLHAPRTVVDWVSFDVGASESVNFTFESRSWIVLNRLQTVLPATIEGIVTGKVGGAPGGNIWFSNPGGFLFTNGAKVDAGSILVSSPLPDIAGFLDPSKLQFSFAGGERFRPGSITLQKGATLTTHGGLLAIVSSNITSDPDTVLSAQGGGSVLLGAASGYTLRLTGTSAGDFDLVDFIIPDAPSGTSGAVAMDLQGAVNGNSVFVAAVSHSAASAVINLEGAITATSASSDGGDIVLSGGGGILGRAPGPAVEGAIDTDFYLTSASAARDLSLRTNGEVFGKPWVRPPPVVVEPPPLRNGNGNGSGNGNGNGNGCGNAFSCEVMHADMGLLTPDLLSAADPTVVSNLTAGRDIKLIATANIEIGSAKANRNLTTTSAGLTANSLVATGDMTLTATAGAMAVASAGVGGNAAFKGAADVELDALGLTSATSHRATIDAGHDAILGPGAFGGSGVIDVTAAHKVSVNATAATLGAVVAGGDAELRGGALNIASVSGANIVGQADSLTIGTATATGDIYLVSLTGDATLGQGTAGDDIYLNAAGSASLTKAVLTGAGPDAVGPSDPPIADGDGNGRVVSLTAGLDAKLGLGTGSVTGATAVTLHASQDALVDVTLALPGAFSATAGRDAGVKAPTAAFDTVTAGRDLSLATTTGDLTISKTLTGARSISVGSAGALTVADVSASAGSITLTGQSVKAGALTASQDLTLKATGGGVKIASYSAGRDVTLQGASFDLGSALAPVGRDLTITAPGDLTIATNLAAGRNIFLDVQGKATLAGVTAAKFDIVATDFDLGGTLTAPTVLIESRAGALRVGGSATDGAPGAGMWFDNAEFGRLRASGSVSLYAGPTAGTARGDLTVLNLAVDPASTPLVTLLAGADRNVLVQGVVAPTASGGALRIGDAASTPWRPSSILVTGSIGSATFQNGVYTGVRAFDDVRLHAQNDILMGSQRFIALVQSTAAADIDIGLGKPSGVAPTSAEQFHVFTAAGRLEVSADGKVVQQNTAPTLASPVGVLLTSKSSPNLIIDPPKTVQLFGAVIDPAGKLVSSFGAGSAITVAVVDNAGNPTSPPAGSKYTFNTCTVGTTQCSGSTLGPVVPGDGGSGSSGSANAFASATASVSQNAPILSSPEALAEDKDQGGNPSKQSGASSSVATTPPPLLALAPVDLREIVTDPVTAGAGSEEIWRKLRATK